ncbi:MAG TPA: hypothetical protein VM529_13125 [Gemmata sp.]|nr:hypothetical protein [Gemmata sp.]
MTSTTAYLIQYGKPGFVGRFRSADRLTRGDRVVVRGPRGDEVGEVLLPLADDSAEAGDVLRPAAPGDAALAADAAARGRDLLADAETAVAEAGLPLALVDVEVTLDGVAILHALAWDACDATPVLDRLAADHGLTVRLLDLSRAPAAAPEPSGCGKPGCGSDAGGCSTCGTGGGCSSGSCSRGAVKSADELTAHFADLRRQMEAAGLVRTPLN